MRDIAQEIVEEGKETASELDQIAWYSLFAGKATDSDMDAALKAAQLSNNACGILHTLGCLYAEVGQLEEARGCRAHNPVGHIPWTTFS